MSAENLSVPLPTERLERMREMFAKEGGILVEDYAHFTGITPPDAPKTQSRVRRKSVTQNVRPSRGPN